MFMQVFESLLAFEKIIKMLLLKQKSQVLISKIDEGTCFEVMNLPSKYFNVVSTLSFG